MSLLHSLSIQIVKSAIEFRVYLPCMWPYRLSAICSPIGGADRATYFTAFSSFIWLEWMEGYVPRYPRCATGQIMK